MLKNKKEKDLLTERERQILQLVAEDLTDEEISNILCLSVRTINYYLRQVYIKLGVRGRTGAVVAALNKNLINTDS